MSDIKFQIKPNQYNQFRATIQQRFPHWLQQRRVQTARNGVNVVLIHPLNGYQLTPFEQMAVDDIVADYEDVQLEMAA